MKKIKLLMNHLLGDPDEISSESYFVILSTLTASGFLFLLCIVHVLMSLKLVPVILAGSSSVVMLGLYYFVRFHKCLFIPKIILTVGGLLMLDLTWYSKYLSNGPVLFFILIFGALVLWVWEGKNLVILMTFYFLNLAVLFYIDYNSPEILFIYPDFKTRSIDIYLSFFLYSLILLFLLYAFKREFLRQKTNAIKSDKLKSAFLANMSHEIRTPMNGILGFSNLLKEPNLSGSKQQQYIDIIEKSGFRMLNIINDIIDISKIEAGLMKLDIKETDLNEQLDYIYTFFRPEVDAKGMKLSLRKTLTQQESVIFTDREKVFAILTNLVKNAIKYSNEGEIEFGNIKRGNYLEFYVRDTGIGIPKEKHKAIFERFIQVSNNEFVTHPGAGLGLAITKSYVKMLGGEIWVESEAGIGSTFYFTIPYKSEATNKSNLQGKIITNGAQPQVRNLKILIAEDDETSEILISRIIKDFGKVILKAKTGNEAVEICRNNPDINLIFMDIEMPYLDGYNATRQIRQFNSKVKIIAQTAFGLEGDKEKAIEAGCDDYLAKPVKKSELLLLIQKYFRN